MISHVVTLVSAHPCKLLHANALLINHQTSPEHTSKTQIIAHHRTIMGWVCIASFDKKALEIDNSKLKVLICLRKVHARVNNPMVNSL
ncbi:hypothetical protein KC19_5G013800 [Ceratodon purpureus]|uniref:Uncharacterized protein n=1 Tax=Ceratodon purpureus TaxID=3225 RepID=A0A8T0HY60_CERPU|nr:hypothetical protein KC19_5G013800 [Ceratodon purpureus]